MKKTICAITACALLLSVLTACAKADESTQPSVSKDTEQMIATASVPSTSAAGQSLRESLGAPTHVEDTAVPTQNEKFSVTISADVSVPDVDHLSVYRVSAGEFSQDFAAKAFDTFCKGKTMYDYGNIIKSRKQLQDRIDSMQNDLDMNDSPDGPAEGDAWRAEYKAAIASLKIELLTAQDDLGDPIMQVQFTQKETTGNGKQERFEAVDAPEQPWTMQFFLRNNVKYATNEVQHLFDGDTTVAPRSEAGLYFYDTSRVSSDLYKLRDVTREAAVTELSMTPSEAMARVSALFDTLGIHDMRPYCVYLASEFNEDGTGDGKYAYYVEARRVVDGVEVQSPFSRTYVGSIDDGYEWAYETLDVRLDDEGIVGMSWLSPLTVGAVEVENANLLPFSSILTVAKNMLCVANEPLEADVGDYDTYAIQIDQISLSLQRIPNANSVEDGLLIPVWNFYGQERYLLSGVVVRRVTSEPVGLGDEPYLSINAIDGSVIDKTLGY